MLVLSRREDDKILFPNLGVTVQILKVAGNKVRVGVQAPDDVKVLRHELTTLTQAPQATGPGAIQQVDQSTGPTTAEEDVRLRKHLVHAAEALADLHSIENKEFGKDSERLIYEVFHHLKQIDEESSQMQSREPVLTAGRARRALLVEDNPNEQRLLASFLRIKKFEVDVASDGAEALDYLSSNEQPDIMLLDMMMPGVDGPTTIRRLRKDRRQRPAKVFAVSAGDPADYGIEIGPEGVDGWFPKPLDPEALAFRLAFEDDSSKETGELAMSS